MLSNPMIDLKKRKQGNKQTYMHEQMHGQLSKNSLMTLKMPGSHDFSPFGKMRQMGESSARACVEREIITKVGASNGTSKQTSRHASR